MSTAKTTAKATAEKRHPYSPTEDKLLKILSSQKKVKIPSSKLTNRYYGGEKAVPMHGRIYVNSALRSLVRKARLNKEKFKIVKEKRDGSRELNWWVE